MRLIFLDIDGVLNSEQWFLERQGYAEYHAMLEQAKSDESRVQWRKWLLDPKAVARLNRIIELTSAKVVVSSTWRKNRSTEELAQILRMVGFKGEILGKTPEFYASVPERMSVPRGMEIKHYLKYQLIETDVESYVILDDEGDMLYTQKDNFVHTTWDDGLTDEDVQKACQILLGKSQYYSIPMR